MRNNNSYLGKPQNINKENLWYLIDTFCSCIWINVELFLESQNTNFIMVFEKGEAGVTLCYIARDDWQWFIEIYDLNQRWLCIEEEDLKYLLSTKPVNFYGDMQQFENDLILFKLFST